MYSETTLIAAVFGHPRRVVVIDGKVYLVDPDPLQPEEIEARDERELNTKAMALSRVRGRMNRINLDGSNLRLDEWSDTRIIRGDTPVLQYHDVTWVFRDPQDGIKGTPYTRNRVRPLKGFAYDAVNGSSSYSVLDGKVIRAVERPSQNLNGLSDEDKALVRSSPDMVTFCNEPMGDPVLIRSTGQMIFQIGRFWADTDRDRATSLRSRPATAGGPSVQF